MGLETGAYVGDLNPNNPTPADPKSQGDDHLRLLKTALRQCFPGFTGSILLGGDATAAADAYTLTPATALLAYSPNMMVVFKAPSGNTTAAVTVKVSALDAKPLRTVDGAALTPGDIVAGQFVVAIYDGTVFRLVAITKGYVDRIAFNTALPNQPGGTDPVELISLGGVAGWQPANIYNYPARIAQVCALSLALS